MDENSRDDDKTYENLRAYLDELPTGFPATESGVEIEILKRIYTPREAEMAVHLRLVAEPSSRIAARCGLPEPETALMLERMAEKGLIYPMRGRGRTLYMALPWMPGILETQVDTVDEEMARLLYEYNPDYFSGWLARDTQMFRVIPVNASVESTPRVETYDRIRELVGKQEHLSVMPCLCRKAQGELGHQCERPLETCFVFGPFSRHFVESGEARYITVDEALEILDACEESALVLQPVNAKELNGMCCCCSCCCMMLREIRQLPRPAEVVQSSFRALIDPDLCNGCGICTDRCQVDAIIEAGICTVDQDRCIGCGLCAPYCPREAITMVSKFEERPVPANVFETLSRIAAERELPFGVFGPMLKYTSSPLFIKSWLLLERVGLTRPVIKLLEKRGIL